MSVLQTININNKTIEAFATASAADNEAFLIGSDVVAVSQVNEISGTYELFGISATMPHNIVTTRGLHAEPNIVNIGSTLVDYTLEEQSLKVNRERVREIERAVKAGNINPLLGDAARATAILQYRMEADIFGLWTNAAVTNTVTVAAAADKWDNYNSVDSDPAADVATAAALIKASSNVPQSQLEASCTEECKKVLQDHPKIQNFFLGAVTAEDLTPDQIARALKIKKLHVSNSGVLDSSDTRSNVHPNAFNLSYKNDQVVGNGLTAIPTFARYIQLKNIVVTSRPHDPVTDLDVRKVGLFGGAVIQNAGMAARIITPLT